MCDRPMTLRPLCLALSRLSMIVLLVLGGCAAAGHRPVAGEEDFNDPLESTNRAIFGFNQEVDRTVLVPAANAYRAVFPEPARDSIHDFLENLRAPIIFVNDVLQANPKLAGDTAARFALNTTIGIAGFVDIAARWGIPYHYQDFGITFGVWGIPEGPYLVIPVLGPSDPRDLTGIIVEGFADPWDILAGNAHYLWAPLIRHAIAGIDERSRYIETLADIQRTSLDYYATIRSLYRQRRNALIRHEEKNLPPNPSLGQGGGPTPIVARSSPPTPSPGQGGGPNPIAARLNPPMPPVVVSEQAMLPRSDYDATLPADRGSRDDDSRGFVDAAHGFRR